MRLDQNWKEMASTAGGAALILIAAVSEVLV